MANLDGLWFSPSARLSEGLMTSQLGFFDLEDRLSALSAAGIHLERLSAALNTLVVKKSSPDPKLFTAVRSYVHGELDFPKRPS